MARRVIGMLFRRSGVALARIRVPVVQVVRRLSVVVRGGGVMRRCLVVTVAAFVFTGHSITLRLDGFEPIGSKIFNASGPRKVTGIGSRLGIVNRQGLKSFLSHDRARNPRTLDGGWCQTALRRRKIAMKTTKLVATIMLAVAATWCFAQGEAPATAQQGAPRRTAPRMQMGPGLLRRADVQDDLQLSADQKSKIADLNKAMREEMAAAQPPAGDSSTDKSAVQAKSAEIRSKYEAQLEAVLTPDQAKRLKEIGIQINGNGIVRNADVAREIGLTDEQAQQIKALDEKRSADTRAIQAKVKAGEMDRAAGSAARKKIRTDADAELAKILTDEQKAKIKAMGGKPFVAKRGG